jgi:hypothetical protein
MRPMAASRIDTFGDGDNDCVRHVERLAGDKALTPGTG